MTTAVKTITHPITGKTFRLGRRRPLSTPRLHLRNYLLQTPLPVAPANIDYSGPALDCLGQIYGNDELGDCTAAGAFHIGGMLLANAGDGNIIDGGGTLDFSSQDAINFYSGSCGYVPGEPQTDQGGDEQTVLNYWKTNGLVRGEHKIAGYAAVDGLNPAQCKDGNFLFENLYFGVELPDAWINSMPAESGFTWDVAGDPDPDNGHCFIGSGYPTNAGVKIWTWGMWGTITWAAIAKYAAIPLGGELYTIFGPDAIVKATAKAPNGFDATQLLADLAAV